jgi:hypothetical protein
MRAFCGVGLVARGAKALGVAVGYPNRDQLGSPWVATYLYAPSNRGADLGTKNYSTLVELALYTYRIASSNDLWLSGSLYKDGVLLQAISANSVQDEVESYDDGGFKVFGNHPNEPLLPAVGGWGDTRIVFDKLVLPPPAPDVVRNAHWDAREPVMTLDETTWDQIPEGPPAPQNWNSQPVTGWDKTTAQMRTRCGDTAQVGHGCWAYVVNGYDEDLSAHTDTPGTPMALGEMILIEETSTGEDGSLTGKRVIDADAVYIRIKMLFSGAVGSTLPGGTFRFRLRYDPEQQQLDESPVYLPDDSYDVLLPIDDDLPANEWTDCYLTIPAGVHGTYLDMDGNARDCKFYDRIVLEQVLGIPEACFREMDDVDPDSTAWPGSGFPCSPTDKFALSWTGGHQVAEQEVPATPGSTPAKECRAFDSLETEAVDGDFEFAVRLRISDPPSAWTATDFRVSAFDKERHEACSNDGRLGGPPIFGTRDGYLGLGPEAGFLPWFGVESRIVWNANPDGAGSTTVFNVQRVHEGVADILSLPTDPDDTGTLAGLLAYKVTRDSDGQYRRWEARRIASNTVGAVTVSTAWTAAPTINDRLLVAPMVEMIHLPEIRTRFFSSLRALALNFDDQTRASNANTFPALFRLEQFEGATDAIQADNATPVATAWFNSNDLRSKREIPVPAKASKARSYRLTWIGRETGACTVRNLEFTETMHSAETGK